LTPRKRRTLHEFVMSNQMCTSDEAVAKLAENCKSLTQLNLAGCLHITDWAMTKLAEKCKLLTGVNLSSGNAIIEDVVTKLAENCKALTVVDLNGCEQISDDDVSKLADNCTGLTAVILPSCNITNEAVKKLAENRKNLSVVHLGFCEQIAGWAVIKLSLTEVSLECRDDITDASLTTLARSCDDSRKFESVGYHEYPQTGVWDLIPLREGYFTPYSCTRLMRGIQLFSLLGSLSSHW